MSPNGRRESGLPARDRRKMSRARKTGKTRKEKVEENIRSAIKTAAVAGPTASGKSRLAVALAKRLHGQVISCDSMQIYRGMDIGTGKVTKEEAEGVPHHLIDIADPKEGFSLAEYIALAREAVLKVTREGFLPILCGGTGLYLDHVLDGTALSEAPGDENIRRKLECLGSEELYAMLVQTDPQSARAVHPNNRKRVIRALEIYHASGVTKTEWDARSKVNGNPYNAKVILLLPGDRQKLYEAIDARVDEMFHRGLEHEARLLFESHPSPTAAQAIGYKEFLPYFEGVATLKEVKERIKQASRNYAKRQLTWFGRRAYSSLCLDSLLPFEEQVERAASYIAEN